MPRHKSSPNGTKCYSEYLHIWDLVDNLVFTRRFLIVTQRQEHTPVNLQHYLVPRVPNRHLVPSIQSPPRRTSPRAVHMEPVPTPPPYPEPKRLLSPRSLRPRFAAAVRGLRLSGFTGNTRTFFFMRTWFSTRFIPTLVLHARLIP